jgi:hypothetical protein
MGGFGRLGRPVRQRAGLGDGVGQESWAFKPKVEKEEDFYFLFLFQYFKCIFK